MAKNTGYHEDAGTGYIHQIYDQEYADDTARDADTSWNGDSDNIGKCVLVTGDNSVFMLLSTAPLWFEFGGAVANPATIYSADSDVAADRTVTAPSNILLVLRSLDLLSSTFTVGADIELQSGQIDIEAYTGNGAGAKSLISRIAINTTQMQILDQINSTGLVYADDYSTAGELLDRWVPDKAWVEAHVIAQNTNIFNIDGTIEADRTVTLDDLTLTFYSNDTDDTTRNLVEITNDNSLASGATALYVQQDADNYGVRIVAEGAALANVLDITADNLTTGSLGRFYSNSSDVSSRNLVEIINDNTLAAAATGLYVKQDADHYAINVDYHGTSEDAVNIVGNSLTGGKLLGLYSDSSDTGERTLLSVWNDNSLAAATTAMVITQDADNPALEIFYHGNTASGLYVNGDSLTTGELARFYSSSTSTGTRNLVEIENASALALSTSLLHLLQNADHHAIYLQAPGVITEHVVDIEADTLGNGASAIHAYSSSGSTGYDVGLFEVESGGAGTALRAVNNNGGYAAEFEGYVEIDSYSNAIGNIFNVTDTSLTTGTLARFYSNSGDVSTREVVQIINDNAAADSATALYIQQDADGTGLDIDTNANGIGISVTGDALSTNNLARFYSNSADTNTRDLVRMVNDNAAADAATVLSIQQDGDTTGVFIDQNGNGRALWIGGDGPTTTELLNVTSGTLTTGRLANFYSNSASDAGSYCVNIQNDNAASLGYALRVSQDGDATAQIITQNGNATGLDIWNPGTTTGFAASFHGTSHTTGGLGDHYSTSVDTSTRYLYKIRNISSLATGATPLYLYQAANSTAFEIDCTGITSDYGIWITNTSSLTTGSAIRAFCNSAGGGYSLASFEVGGSGVSSSSAGRFVHSGDGNALTSIGRHGETANSTTLNHHTIDGDTVTTANVLDVTADGLTTGAALSISSNSPSTSTRNLIYAINDNVLATAVSVAKFVNDADWGVTVDSDGYVKMTGHMRPPTTVTGNHTVADGDTIILCNHSAAMTITIPTAMEIDGMIFTVKDRTGLASTRNITIQTAGTSVIDGNATHTISEDRGVCTMVFDDVTSAWHIISAYGQG